MRRSEQEWLSMNWAPERLAVFVNPVAGGGRAARAWELLRANEPELAAARLVLNGDAESARRELDEHLAELDAVVALGGDGTAHFVANRLLASRRVGDVALGLIPAGTGSDLARCLALPKSPIEGWRRLVSCEPRAIDVLEVTTEAGGLRYVVNVASVGVSGAVAESVNSIANRKLFTYLAGAVRALASYEPAPCRISVDGEELYDGRFFVAAVANGRSFGRGMRIAPRAKLDDGLADVVLVPPFPLWKIPQRIAPLYTGGLLEWPGVRFAQGRSVRVEPHGPMPPFDADGETLASGPATIRLLPKALRVLA